jgi:hypothetical protein
MVKRGRQITEPLVKLWSIQDPNVLDHLRDGRYTASYEHVPRNRLDGTRWMADQMRARDFSIGLEDAPIWALLKYPDPSEDPVWGNERPGKTKVLLRLALPSSRILVSFHFPWVNQCLGRNPSNFYLASNQLDATERRNRVRPPDECLRSWQKLFDLDQINRPGFTWWNSESGPPPSDEILFRLQATVPFLLPGDVEAIGGW